MEIHVDPEKIKNIFWTSVSKNISRFEDQSPKKSQVPTGTQDPTGPTVPGPKAAPVAPVAPAAPAVAPERQSWANGQVQGREVMGDPQVTLGLKAKMVIHDLDDLGVQPFRESSIWARTTMFHIEKSGGCGHILIKHVLKVDGHFQSLLSFEKYWGPRSRHPAFCWVIETSN